MLRVVHVVGFSLIGLTWAMGRLRELWLWGLMVFIVVFVHGWSATANAVIRVHFALQRRWLGKVKGLWFCISVASIFACCYCCFMLLWMLFAIAVCGWSRKRKNINYLSLLFKNFEITHLCFRWISMKPYPEKPFNLNHTNRLKLGERTNVREITFCSLIFWNICGKGGRERIWNSICVFWS